MVDGLPNGVGGATDTAQPSTSEREHMGRRDAEGGAPETAQPSTSGRDHLERRDASGAPVPLHPALLTLALLPRSQWQGLVHLDAIKVPIHAATNL